MSLVRGVPYTATVVQMWKDSRSVEGRETSAIATAENSIEESQETLDLRYNAVDVLSP